MENLMADGFQVSAGSGGWRILCQTFPDAGQEDGVFDGWVFR